MTFGWSSAPGSWGAVERRLEDHTRRRWTSAGEFDGVVNLELLDSTPDWQAFCAASWGPYGGRVEPPRNSRPSRPGC